MSYYGLVAHGISVDKVHIHVLLLASDWQVVVVPPHRSRHLPLWATRAFTSQSRRTWGRKEGRNVTKIMQAEFNARFFSNSLEKSQF